MIIREYADMSAGADCRRIGARKMTSGRRSETARMRYESKLWRRHDVFNPPGMLAMTVDRPVYDGAGLPDFMVDHG